jgi:hypothetical protein
MAVEVPIHECDIGPVLHAHQPPVESPIVVQVNELRSFLPIDEKGSSQGVNFRSVTFGQTAAA